MTAEPIEYIYELRDVTDDETYYVIGRFLQKDAAMTVIEEYDRTGKYLCDIGSDDGAEDYEAIELHKLPLGHTGLDGNTRIARIERESFYDDAKDDYVWRTKEPVK